ncbi:caspase family protein [Pontibacter sp. G13]|uniref:caspase family protein n=1 Tax=Pontibacter sp. G13 TaxID=3074898 RepID=UPI00288C2784|nr:caspase family protein [Pontibacter sp. G13]WNJ16013.1 caspase family protein [Pontibacter sp. G13]
MRRRNILPSFRWLTCLCVLAVTVLPNDLLGQQYRSGRNQDVEVLFEDEFLDNRNHWELESHYAEESIFNDEFHITTLNEMRRVQTKNIPLDPYGDYEINLSFRFQPSEGNTFSGITFGGDRASEFMFLVNQEGRFVVNRYDRGRQDSYLDQKNRYGFHKYGYQNLTVAKQGNLWIFLVGGKELYRMESRTFFGSEIGFVVGGKSNLEIDFLKVTQIPVRDFDGPQIFISQPMLNDNGMIFVNERQQKIKGKVYDKSAISHLVIGNTRIKVNNGSFEAGFELKDNRPYQIDVTCFDTYGNSSTETFRIQYVDSPQDELVYQPYNTQGNEYQYQNNATRTPKREEKKPTIGENYLLVIGVNSYSQWNPLHNAVKDCKDIANTLTTYYDFSPDHVISRFNEEATRENILETFEYLQERLTEHDNLIIYYAGHGYYDKSSELGYWVPVDARLNKIPDYIRNSTIHDYLRTIDTKHTFLIADACYAGSLFGTTRGNLDRDARSRWAFTSGDIEKVWDGRPGTNSPFAKYLIKFLRENPKNTFTVEELIQSVSPLVQRNTQQNPQGAALRQVGDDGGVFEFTRR